MMPYERQLILLMDEDPESRNFLEQRLPPALFEFANAPDPGGAMAEIDARRPCLIMVDGDRPDGLTLCDRIKSDESLAELPVVVISTGRGKPPLIAHWFSATSADYYVSRPLRVGPFESYLRDVLTRSLMSVGDVVISTVVSAEWTDEDSSLIDFRAHFHQRAAERGEATEGEWGELTRMSTPGEPEDGGEDRSGVGGGPGEARAGESRSGDPHSAVSRSAGRSGGARSGGETRARAAFEEARREAEAARAITTQMRVALERSRAEAETAWAEAAQLQEEITGLSERLEQVEGGQGASQTSAEDAARLAAMEEAEQGLRRDLDGARSEVARSEQVGAELRAQLEQAHREARGALEALRSEASAAISGARQAQAEIDDLKSSRQVLMRRADAAAAALEQLQADRGAMERSAQRLEARNRLLESELARAREQLATQREEARALPSPALLGEHAALQEAHAALKAERERLEQVAERARDRAAVALAESDRLRAAYERARAETEAAWAEAAQAQSEADAARAESDRLRAVYERAREEAENAWAEAAQVQAEVDTVRADAARFQKQGAAAWAAVEELQTRVEQLQTRVEQQAGEQKKTNAKLERAQGQAEQARVEARRLRTELARVEASLQTGRRVIAPALPAMQAEEHSADAPTQPADFAGAQARSGAARTRFEGLMARLKRSNAALSAARVKGRVTRARAEHMQARVVKARHLAERAPAWREAVTQARRRGAETPGVPDALAVVASAVETHERATADYIKALDAHHTALRERLGALERELQIAGQARLLAEQALSMVQEELEATRTGADTARDEVMRAWEERDSAQTRAQDIDAAVAEHRAQVKAAREEGARLEAELTRVRREQTGLRNELTRAQRAARDHQIDKEADLRWFLHALKG